MQASLVRLAAAVDSISELPSARVPDFCELLVLVGLAAGLADSARSSAPELDLLLREFQLNQPMITAKLGMSDSQASSPSAALLQGAGQLQTLEDLVKLAQPKLSVFGGALKLAPEALGQALEALAIEMNQYDFCLAYGGGDYGLPAKFIELVGKNSDRFVLGISSPLYNNEPAHHETVRIVADSLSARKDLLATSDAFLVLPGGTGSLDEFAHVLETLKSNKDSSKRIAVFSPELEAGIGYFSPLERMLNQMVSAGALSSSELERVLFSADPKRIAPFVFGLDSLC
jgi:uncharacterized protein (TIGR00730 family)